MAGRPTAAHEAAKKQYEAAPRNAKPSATALARKHGLAESNIHRAAWYFGAGDIAGKVTK